MAFCQSLLAMASYAARLAGWEGLLATASSAARLASDRVLLATASNLLAFGERSQNRYGFDKFTLKTLDSLHV